VPKLEPPSFAWRFSFASASRFICSFICEYLLKCLRIGLPKQLRDPLIRNAAGMSRVAYVTRHPTAE